MSGSNTNVYLQTMKTYIPSVNTLMWNLTSERHDNCASCLGLILPIRWVTPPPNFCLKCFPWRYICEVFIFDLSSSCWFGLILVIHIFMFYPLHHSLIAMTLCWIFWSKWMWLEPNLSMLLPQLYLSKSYAFYWNLSIVFTEALLAKVNLTNIYVCF